MQMIETNKKTLKEFYLGLSQEVKRKVEIDLQVKLRRSYMTIYSWLNGKRNIGSPAESDIVRDYIRDNFQVEIIEEGAKP